MQKQKVVLNSAVVAVLALLVAGVGALTKQKRETITDTSTDTEAVTENTPTTTASATTNSTSTSVSTATPTAVQTSGYKDGNYSATGKYTSPEGSESITVTVTLTNGVVTTSNVIGNGRDGTTQEFQSSFISGYKQFVVGKNIDDIKLTRVSGSSLTSKGFNDALTTIKSQAKG